MDIIYKIRENGVKILGLSRNRKMCSTEIGVKKGDGVVGEKYLGVGEEFGASVHLLNFFSEVRRLKSSAEIIRKGDGDCRRERK